MPIENSRRLVTILQRSNSEPAQDPGPHRERQQLQSLEVASWFPSSSHSDMHVAQKHIPTTLPIARAIAAVTPAIACRLCRWVGVHLPRVSLAVAIERPLRTFRLPPVMATLTNRRM